MYPTTAPCVAGPSALTPYIRLLFILPVIFLEGAVRVWSQAQDIQLLGGGVLTGMNFLNAEDGAVVRVMGPVTVADTGSLTIGPGIELHFPQSGEITVLGET